MPWKKRLLLEVNKEIDWVSMINLIIMGLADYIMYKMDKGSITSTANLYNEIGKHEHTIHKNNYDKLKKKHLR